MANLRSIWNLLVRNAPRLVLTVLALALMATTPNFFTADNFASILGLASLVGVLAVGQAYVLIGGGFDLSQSAILALTAAVAAMLATSCGMSFAAIAPLILLMGAVLGSVNGLFVAAAGTNPFVTTLSTQLIYRGAAFLVLQGLPIRNVRAFALLDQGPMIGLTQLPNRAFVFLALAAVSWLVLAKTVFGRHVYAVGGNVRAARLSGLPTIRLRTAAFAISGAASGLAAMMLLSWVRVAKADTGVGMELDAIAACVVGGISLQGGSGSVLGAAFGCLVLQALSSYITIRGFPDEFRSLATGAVILVFAAADALARRAR
jgi:ribose transport system permease protein